MSKLRVLTLLVLVGLCVCSLPAMADSVVYNNFGSGFSYNCCTGGTLGGSGSPVGLIDQGVLFTAQATGNVSEIDVAIGWVVGTNGATVQLWNADSNGLPSTIASPAFDINNLQQFGNCCAYSAITGISGVSVTQGQQYVLVASTPNDTWDAWNWNSINDIGQVDYTTDGVNWNAAPGSTLYTFQILATGVPEPGTFVMLGSGVLAIAGVFRRKLGL